MLRSEWKACVLGTDPREGSVLGKNKTLSSESQTLEELVGRHSSATLVLRVEAGRGRFQILLGSLISLKGVDWGSARGPM